MPRVGRADICGSPLVALKAIPGSEGATRNAGHSGRRGATLWHPAGPSPPMPDSAMRFPSRRVPFSRMGPPPLPGRRERMLWDENPPGGLTGGLDDGRTPGCQRPGASSSHPGALACFRTRGTLCLHLGIRCRPPIPEKVKPVFHTESHSCNNRVMPHHPAELPSPHPGHAPRA